MQPINSKPPLSISTSGLKTLKELNKVKGASPVIQSIENIDLLLTDIINNKAGATDAFADLIKKAKELQVSEQQRLKILSLIQEQTSKYNDLIIKATNNNKDVKKELLVINREVADIEYHQEQVNKSQKIYNELLKVTTSALDPILRKNKQLFEIARDMQVVGNLTWKQYSQMYAEAFDQTRRLNREMSKFLMDSRDIMDAQNKLIGEGWKNMDISTLSRISSQFALAQKTLGDIPASLAVAFQMSYRQFGVQTDQLVGDLFNRMNAFSNTFGMNIAILSGTVEEMFAANSFMFRANMGAQLKANEALMRAAALTTSMGLNSTTFFTNLAGTAMYGTAEEMAGVYQTGAYLQGFNTQQFQQQIQAGQADLAAEQLFRSIGTTLTNMSPGYLQNQYIAEISKGFGLSRDEILQIMANQGDINKYIAKINEEGVNAQTSMIDELRGLKEGLTEQLQRLWTNTPFAETVGKILQDTELVGTAGLLKGIQGQLFAIIAGQNKTLIANTVGKVSGLFGTGGSAASAMTGIGALSPLASASTGLSGLARFGLGAGGLALGIGGNAIGYNMIANNTNNTTGKNVGGWLTNIGTGIAGGAITGGMIGQLPGAIIGGIMGGIGGVAASIAAANERKSRMQELDDAARNARRAAQGSISTGNPVVDAIQDMKVTLVDVFQGEFSHNRQFQALVNLTNQSKLPSVTGK